MAAMLRFTKLLWTVLLDVNVT